MCSVGIRAQFANELPAWELVENGRYDRIRGAASAARNALESLRRRTFFRQCWPDGCDPRHTSGGMRARAERESVGEALGPFSVEASERSRYSVVWHARRDSNPRRYRGV